MIYFLKQVGFCLFFLFIFLIRPVYGQPGGGRSFEFINMPSNARVAGLGGINVSVSDKDVNMLLSNPALISESTHNHVSLNHFLYLADISLSNLVYGFHHEKAGSFALGLQYLNYGSFEAYDETGLEQGNFGANEYAVTLGNSRSIKAFTIGASLKYVSSTISSFHSGAILMDIGGIFKHPQKDFTVGMVIKNFGVVVREYSETSQTNLPFDVQLGTSFKPEFMPLRFSFTAYNLYRPGDSYPVPPRSSQNNNQESGTVDKIMRHLNFGAEVILSKNVNLRAGYNHLIRKELRIDEYSGGAGISLGLMFRIKAFEFAYSKAFYHVAGGSDYFTLTSNLNSIFKNKKELNE